MKEFLEHNKIYFEVIVSSLLAIMAIIVSWQANSIADSQATLAEDANRIAMLEHIPEIEVEFRLIRSNNGTRTEHLVVMNKGKPLYEFDSYSVAFLSIKESELVSIDNPSNRAYERVGMMLPIENYYPIVKYRPNNNVGEIHRQEVLDVNKLQEAIEGFNRLLSVKKKTANSSIKRYTRASYVDVHGEQYTQYFKIGVGGDGIPISVNEGSEVYSFHKQLTEAGQVIDYDNTAPDRLLSFWENNKKPI